jgi:hypothetical protein
MGRRDDLNAAFGLGMFALQEPSSVAGLFALALVTHTLAPWRPPEGAALEQARKRARRFKIADDLAIFMPPEPGRFASRAKKDAYRGLLISLKRLDELQGEERERAIAELRMLLGSA